MWEGRRVSVQVAGCCPAQAELPLFVAAGGATCSWDAAARALELRLPRRPPGEVVEELRRAAPHSRQALQLASVDDDLV